MKPSGSYSVMAQRSEPHDSLDDFPTPCWGTRALVEHVLKPLNLPLGSAWEPACNRGYMSRALSETFKSVFSSDVFDYSAEWEGQQRVVDFLWPDSDAKYPVDFIISNPPFRLAEQFIWRARSLAKVGCAMLVRTSFLESVGRYERLYCLTPPTIIAQFAERLPMVKGRVDQKASTATSYAWLVWLRDFAPQPFQWIPPCRAQLECDSDYVTDGAPQMGAVTTPAPSRGPTLAFVHDAVKGAGEPLPLEAAE